MARPSHGIEFDMTAQGCRLNEAGLRHQTQVVLDNFEVGTDVDVGALKAWSSIFEMQNQLANDVHISFQIAFSFGSADYRREKIPSNLLTGVVKVIYTAASLVLVCAASAESELAFALG